MKMLTVALFTTGLAASACSGSFAVRNEGAYKSDTRMLLSAHNSKIKTCYDKALAQDATVAGVVVVKFKVKAETGAVVEAAVDAAGTTAPAALSTCVVRTLDGLFLEPADKNDGHATFRWDFSSRG